MSTNTVIVVTIFFPPFLSGYSFFYTIFLFHLHPSRVDQTTGVDSYLISTFLKSLAVVVRLKITVQVSLPH